MLIIKLEDSGNLGYRVNEKICFDLDARLDFIIMIKKLMVKHNEHSLIKVLNTNFIFDHEYI